MAKRTTPTGTTNRTDRQLFAAWLQGHGLTAYAAAPLLGITKGQAYKVLRGECPVTPMLARLLDLLNRHGIPADWRDSG